ncbi:MAG: P1 family peptidase [Bryobacteraceae bacterium]|nr:P1 family peptidase [Bryobacteraceae bacterium]
MTKGLTDIPGLKVGHATDLEGLTGCTVILCEGGATAGVEVRGAASGTQEIDTLNPMHVTDRIHGLVFAGGSAFGLEAASGVRRYLEQKGSGFDMRVARVPIVPAAILFDLGLGKASARPTREMGMTAAAMANDGPVAEGNVGAGTGASVGKIHGMTRAMKGGIGTATVGLEGRYHGVLVSALAAVNAWGDVRDPESGKILAGARVSAASREFVDTVHEMKRGVTAPPVGGPTNTTLVVVATNAALTKIQATRVAQLAQVGLSRVVSPCYTRIDGDVVFCLSPLGIKMAADVDTIGVAAAEAVAEAIVRAVKRSAGLGGIPGIGS